MKTKNSIVRTFLLTAAVAGVSFSGQLSAQSACKGLENSACSANASCSWVEGYERKDGRKVKSFCRTKSAAKKKVLGNASKTTGKKTS